MRYLDLQNIYPNARLESVYFEIGEGWYDIILPVVEYLDQYNKNSSEPIKLIQVKEKFGTLRIYANKSDEELNRLINIAENLSSKTCESCGKDGRIRSGGWIRTLCDEHHVESKVKDIKKTFDFLLKKHGDSQQAFIDFLLQKELKYEETREFLSQKINDLEMFINKNIKRS